MPVTGVPVFGAGPSSALAAGMAQMSMAARAEPRAVVRRIIRWLFLLAITR